MPGLALLKNASCKRYEEDLLRGWQKVTDRKVLSWDYECWPKDFTSAPYVFGKTVQSHYSDMKDVLYGAYVCGSATDPRTELSTYIWMKCPGGMDSWTFFDWLLETTGVVGTPGVGFGSCGEGFFRLTAFGNAEKTKIAAERVKNAILSLNK